jgi:hypothetical protein
VKDRDRLHPILEAGPLLEFQEMKEKVKQPRRHDETREDFVRGAREPEC